LLKKRAKRSCFKGIDREFILIRIIGKVREKIVCVLIRRHIERLIDEIKKLDD